MELAELTAYAAEKYQIREERKWNDFPGFSVLCHPQTGKWTALLMRQWDTDTGREIECCDLKCGRETLRQYPRPYLSGPVRMRGSGWISIAFDDRTEKEIVFQLFDKAVASGMQHGAVIILDSQPVRDTGTKQAPGHQGAAGRDFTDQGTAGRDFMDQGIAGRDFMDQGAAGRNFVYQDTLLPFAGRVFRPEKEKLPERLREMRHLYQYGRETEKTRAENFYRQALFMQDYEDCYPWSGNFICYYPNYQELTTKQLRGYFSWRTQLRRGVFEPIAASAAYIYIYELLNSIGAASPEDALQKMKDFETRYVDAGFGDSRMKYNLRRWMMDFAILHDLPPETASEAADPDMIKKDLALSLLRKPGDAEDEELFPALCTFGGKKLAASPVITRDPERGRHLFCEAWRKAAGDCRREKDLFVLCFGQMITRPWYPLSNAVYYDQSLRGDRDYVLNASRSYHRRNGKWQVASFENLLFDKAGFQGFLHEADVLLRRYLKTGRYLREKPEDVWAVPYITSVIEDEKKARIEAARPKITIDFSGLDQIRRDAETTRDSLLTEWDTETASAFPWDRKPSGSSVRDEEEGFPAGNAAVRDEEECLPAGNAAVRDEGEGLSAGNAAGRNEERGHPAGNTAVRNEGGCASSEIAPGQAMYNSPPVPLDPVQIEILRALLRGEDAKDIVRAHHLLPSIAADAINEALIDEFGDIVLECEDDTLSLVDEYIGDIRQMFGGIIDE